MSKTFKIVTNIVIIFLAFVFLLYMGLGIVNLSDAMTVYTDSEDMMLYDLRDGQYRRLVESYHTNMVADVNATQTMEECYAIARYYEAAIDYKLAIQENDTALKEKSEEIMNTAAGEMGALSYAKGEIDELLGI